MKSLENEKKQKRLIRVLQIAVLLLILLVQGSFVVQKEGYHMDEMLSFELANAEYNPWIIPTQPVGRLAKFMHEEIDGETVGETLGNLVDTIKDVLQNRGGSKLLSYQADVYPEPVWITGEQFQEYVTTGKGDRFNYLSVYFNVKDDNHPPLHFMLLHTISSLFPGKVVPLMGCIINLAAVLGCALIWMKLGEKLDQWQVFNGEGCILGMAAAVLYGCSQAACATVLLIRMYGVLTFLCVLLFYIHVKKWKENGFQRRNAGLVAVTVLGFLNQYFFLFYCLILAAVTVGCLLWYRRKREAWVYVRSMIAAGLLGVGIYPFSVGDVFASSRGVEALGNLAGGLGDYCVRLLKFGEILLARCFGNIWLGCLFAGCSLAAGVWLFIRKKAMRPLMLFLYVPALGYFFLAAKMSPMYVDRYLMCAFPFVITWFVLTMGVFVIWILRRVKGGRLGQTVCLLAAVGVVVYCGFHVLTYDGTYLFRGYEKQLKIAEEYRELSCICLYEGTGYYDNLLEFREYEKTLLTTPEELLERSGRAEVEQLQEVIIIVKSIVSEEEFQKVLEAYQLQVEQVLLKEGPTGDSIYLCGR